tara:strand:+ start:58 stop:1359 length:1302 start_codon:yes stop_codon:yes gene_type:complete
MALTQTQQAYYDGDDFGGYQVISLQSIIDNFLATYVGEGKVLQKTLASDVSFHAHRALQELSFDTLKSCKSQEIEIPPSLTMPLPQDYVNYVKLSWVDSSGIKHIIYPTSKTSNPTPILQDTDGGYKITTVGTLVVGTDTITLDSSYANITVGMNAYAPSIPLGTTVLATSTVSGITTVTISGVAADTATEDVVFYPSNGSIQQQPSASEILTGLSWVGFDNKITAASVGDASKITIGMLISHEDFVVGTTVIDVNGAEITASTNSLNTLTSGNANFVMYEDISDTWSRYKSATPSENNNDDYEDDTYWPAGGERYGLDPQHAQVNGSFFMDCANGKIHFSSNLSGKTIILDYISDGHGTTEEMVVHKFAEEAMYKWIAYGCLSARVDVPEYVINRFKKERFAETRKAKLRLSNIKLEEITQILRGKSKQIKH